MRVSWWSLLSVTGLLLAGWLPVHSAVGASRRTAKRPSKHEHHKPRTSTPKFWASVRLHVRTDRVRVETVLHTPPGKVPSQFWLADAVTGPPWAMRARLIAGPSQWVVRSKRAAHRSRPTRLSFGPDRMSGWWNELPRSARWPKRRGRERLEVVEVRPIPWHPASAGWELQVRLPFFRGKPVALTSVAVVAPSDRGEGGFSAAFCDGRGYGRSVPVVVVSAGANPVASGSSRSAPRRKHRDLCLRWQPSVSDAGVVDSQPPDAGLEGGVTERSDGGRDGGRE